MGIYVEALILYILLFFSGSASLFSGSVLASGEQDFLILMELTRILTYTLPSLALIWYLLLKHKKASEWGIKPGKKDLISAVFTFPCLMITGFAIAFISPYISEQTIQITLRTPSGVFEWIILGLSCTAAAYLEESFFRFYLLSRRKELKLKASYALVFSVALFSICHLYEGPWGFLNAVLSGTLLSFMFLRYKSLHGIAISHALYNFAVYFINAKVGN